MFKQSGLKEKIAVVTGGAKGIGRAIVELLAEEAANVYFIYHSSQEQALSLQDDLRGKGLKATAMCADVRDKTQIAATMEEIYNTTNRIDILVNNSGIIRDHLLAALEEDDVKDVLATNIQGLFNACQAVAPFMMRQRAGKIINISSVAAEKGGRGQTNYAASKGAINAFTRSLAVELATRNVTVNAVAPGVIETDMSQAVRDLGGEEILSKLLIKRFGQPKDIANMVTFLASSYADYITGQIFTVDGGFKMA